MEKDHSYWENLRPHTGVLLPRNNNGLLTWKSVPTYEVDLWIKENCRADYNCYPIEVEPTEVSEGELQLRWHTMWHTLTKSTEPPPTKVKRYYFVFENEADAILFKMRWF